MNWTPARDKEKYGVAIYNFSGINDSCIKLNVGETVHILEEVCDWYFGYALHNKSLRGVFPKAFIEVRDCIVDKTGLVEVVTARLPPIVQEVTAVLREWGVLLRKLYVERSDSFELLRDTMQELLAYRSKILSGKLPGDEQKRLKHRITHGIDRVNSQLGLDLVVRDEHGNILNPDITSAVKLFRHHDEAASRLSKVEADGRMPTVRKKPHLSWTALVTITNIIVKVPEPSEISLGLYIGDVSLGKEKPLSEAFIIPWCDEGYNSQPDLLMNLKCLFTDLSTSMLDDSQIWLVASVVRQGSMSSREVDPKRVSSFLGRKTTSTDCMRRPFGILMMDITKLVKTQKQQVLDGEESKEKDYCASFYPCGEKETLDMRKLQSSKNEGVRDNKLGFQGIWFSFELINGDLKQLREENPHYVSLRDVPVALRLGLSDIIMPGDVRNDLYITLISGEFTRGAKTSDRNVEVTIRIVNEKGKVIPGVIHQGCGKGPLDEYRSVTYHHENRPKWMETVKIALPIEEFKKAHIKFTFKHRSTNDVKDKNEKPFAMSFVKLMQDNGTTLFNTEHDLIIYKIDSKKWQDDDISYLKLAWRRENGEELVKTWTQGVAPSSKDNFTISTTFCSTKLTQNAELLGLLEWGWSGSTNITVLQERLEGLRQVPSEELMVFLQDTLDVLLEILMNNSTSDDSDNKVFEALVYVITIATDKNKHEAFQPVLDSYIQQNFHATLAYNKLIHVLKFYVEQGVDTERQETLKKAMKCLQYVFKFIIRSRQLFVELHGRGQEEFEKSLQQLLEAMAQMMVHTNDTTLTVQAHCLKYITTTIPDIITNFDPISMSNILVKMIDNLDQKRIPKQKLMTLNDIIHSELFKFPECRAVLLPCFIRHIKRLLAANEEVTDSEVIMRKEKTMQKVKKLLGSDHNTQIDAADDRSKTEELELCVKILGDILDVLFSADIGSTYDDITLLSEEMLESILSIVSKMTREDPLNCKFVAVLVSLLRQMNEKHFSNFLLRFSTQDVLYHFMVELQVVIHNLIDQEVFNADWAEMILLQNYVIVKVLKQLSRVISDKMRDPFREQIWCNFFLCAIKFITQDSLQLEKFTPSKRSKILSRYRDMRRDTAVEIRSLWFSLGQHKIRFVATAGTGQSMVGPFLEMTMLPEVELRKATIPIFFDMMQCEFYSLRDQGRHLPPDMARNNQKNKGKFNEFENEMLEKLDHLVEGGRGDDHYREVFQNMVGALCEDHATMREPGLKLVNTVSRLMDRLLQYRTIMNTPDNSVETRMSCTVNLLDFYSGINRKELYLRYVYKLKDLHLGCDNYTEAGYTLLQHANLLRWSSETLSPALRSPNFPQVTQHDELKEKLYEWIIGYFDKGQMWEDALKLCKELVQQYEEIMMNYSKLSDLLKRMASFYENIMNPQNLRPEPEYFRVAFYGRGFPAFLQNKVFVYRGNGFERLADFTSRILDQFPNAELMKKLTPPSDEVKESPQQFIQISKVDCVMHENQYSSPKVSEQIQRYYRANHVNVFTYSRPFHRGQKDPTNEFATLCIEKTTLHTSYPLPGILRCFPVVKTKSVELSPLENALETMANVNENVHELVRKYARDSSVPLEPLTRKLSGMVDPAVMGGIANYEKAFLGEDYILAHPNDEEKLAELRRLIASQIPLLEAGLSIHASRVSEQIAALHDHLVISFSKMKTTIQEKYGAEPMPDDLRTDIRPLRLQTQLSVSSDTSQRLSHQYDSFSSPVKGKMGGTLPRNHKNSLPDLGLPVGGSISKSSKKEKSISKLLRRESFTSPSTQWFDRPDSQISVTPQPIIELSEQVTTPIRTLFQSKSSINNKNKSRPSLSAERPLRPEIERDRRMSRPHSFNLSTPSVSTTPSPSLGSRESLTPHTPTGSLPEDEAPPPLPVKMRDQDSGEYFSSRMSSLSIKSGKLVPPIPAEISSEPPEKPPRPDKNHIIEDASVA